MKNHLSKELSKEIFLDSLKRAFHKYVQPDVNHWTLMCKDEYTFMFKPLKKKDIRKLKVILSWVLGLQAFSLSGNEILHHLSRQYKHYDSEDYYFRKYADHIF